MDETQAAAQAVNYWPFLAAFVTSLIVLCGMQRK